MSNKSKYLVIFGVLVFLSLLGYLFLPRDEIVSSNNIDDSADEYIFVHIEGQVKKPGLIQVKYGTRLYEVIEQAGGETEEADLTRVNLASVVNDEQKVVIPAKIVNSDETIREMDDVLININTASKEKLMTLDGIGEKAAEKIIKYREENGYFNAIEDLMNVSGIGQSKFNGLKEDITV